LTFSYIILETAVYLTCFVPHHFCRPPISPLPKRLLRDSLLTAEARQAEGLTQVVLPVGDEDGGLCTGAELSSPDGWRVARPASAPEAPGNACACNQTWARF